MPLDAHDGVTIEDVISVLGFADTCALGSRLLNIEIRARSVASEFAASSHYGAMLNCLDMADTAYRAHDALGRADAEELLKELARYERLAYHKGAYWSLTP